MGSQRSASAAVRDSTGLGLDQAEILARREDVARRAPAVEQRSAQAQNGLGAGEVDRHRRAAGAMYSAVLQRRHGAAVGPGGGAAGAQIEHRDPLAGPALGDGIANAAVASLTGPCLRRAGWYGR